jgi:ABC-type multidrug transport system fused ATPase/permease subunit
MEELDLLKKAWQKDTQSFQQVTENEIYKMLHKNSSSSVKWILIISILEFVLWTFISVFFNADEYIKQLHAEEMMVYLKILTYINYAVILWFLYRFYTNYVKISATTSTKQLMKDILRTRKTVQNYVWYNLGMMLISMIIGFIMAFLYNPQLSAIKDKIAHDESNGIIIKIVCILSLATIVFLVIFWLFYKLLYGFLLRRLSNNYKELKKIDL